MWQEDIYHINTNSPTPTQKQFDFTEKKKSIKTRKGKEIVRSPTMKPGSKYITENDFDTLCHLSHLHKKYLIYSGVF